MSQPLLIPVTLDILLANPALRQRDAFRRWKHTYTALSSDVFHHTEPQGFDANIDDGDKAGAFLHWTLPRALRSSHEASSTQYPLVPNRWLVTRISRDAQGRNVPKFWIIESDCPSTGAEGASYFMVDEATVAAWHSSAEPNRRAARPVPILTAPVPLDAAPVPTGAYTVNIGMTYDPSTWKEQAGSHLFLTAVAPGNLEFSAYVPFHEGVFAFYDDLLDAPDVTTLSYLVTGWYSDPGQDILTPGPGGFTGGETLDKVLAALNWTLAGQAPVPAAPATSLYAGMAFGLSWNRLAPTPTVPDQLEDTRAAKNMTVAIANTSADSFSTLVATQLQQVPGYSDPAKVIELLRAFHYDLLPLLNEVNGDALLAERVRQEWFHSKAGGTRWTIVAEQPEGEAKPDPAAAALTTAEQAWLLQLNLDQQALDEALQTLHRLQWDLHAAWWKTGYLNAAAQQISLSQANPLNLDPADEAKLLDVTNENSLLSQVLRQLQLINGLLARVPQPAADESANAQAAFLAGIRAFAAQRGLVTGKVLKAVAQPRFWAPNNPNLLISGVEPAAVTDPDASLTVRLTSQQIQALQVDGSVIQPGALGAIIPPLPNAQALPAGVAGIYQEFFLLDPTNAAQIAAQAKVDASHLSAAMLTHDPAAYVRNGAVLPDLPLTLWQQQWQPLYLEWELLYTDVPFEFIDPNTHQSYPNWHFDGTDYVLNPSVRGAAEPETIRGRSLLSPHAQFTFGARLKAFLDQYGSQQADLQKLYEAIAGADSWRFLSQELSGFNELLTQRDPRAFRKPTTETFPTAGQSLTFEKVTGYPGTPSLPPYDTPAAAQGQVNSTPAVKADGASEFPFHGIRSGQLYFTHVVLYDKFGRQLELIVPGAGGTLDARNFPLVRDAALAVSTNLTPTVMAPAQLPPRLLQAARLDLHLVDHRADAHVLGLAPEVNPVGGWVLANHLNQSIQLFANTGQSLGELSTRGGTVQWMAPPHSTLTEVEVADQAPLVGSFLSGIVGKAEAEFRALLGAIDSTLWTTEPLGSRTDENLSVLIGRPLALLRLRLQFALDGPPLTSCDWPSVAHTPDFTSARFSVRLGNLATREDGVIGYFEEQNYGTFNSVVTPADGQGYVREIGPVGAAGANYPSLPFDGRTATTLTLLVDPRAAIHATTGILPVKSLTIPRQFVDPALAQLEVSFRLGPLLSRLKPITPTGTANAPLTTALSYLPLSEKSGTWSWWESTLQPAEPEPLLSWQSYSLTDATPTAALGGGPATLREGYLQLLINLAPDQE